MFYIKKKCEKIGLELVLGHIFKNIDSKNNDIVPALSELSKIGFLTIEERDGIFQLNLW